MEAAFEAPCCTPAQPLMKSETPEAPAQAAKADVAGAKALLFKTPTCPNCKAAMALLDRAGIVYTALNANEEKELAVQYGVKQAPTLVLIQEDGFQKFRGVSDIKGWLMSRQ